MSKDTKPYVQPGEPLHEFLRSFWQRQIDSAEQETIDYRHPPLPLARIKKVMKSDPDVKMIAADAPILFCKACEIFIAEITARAFIIADSNKRRTLSRADIAKAVNKSDQFDFLIDILPREEPFAAPATGPSAASGSKGKKAAPKEAAKSAAASREEMQADLRDSQRTPMPHSHSNPVVLEHQLQSMMHPSGHSDSRGLR